MPNEIRRRRLSALLALAGLSLLAGLVTALLTASPDERPSPAAGLTNTQLAGQRVIAGFEGRRPPASLRRLIRAGRVAGVILFEDNLPSPAAARRLTDSLQAIPRPRGLGVPLLVMADQEGGDVRRLDGAPERSAAELGSDGPTAAAEAGRATGELLAGAGINVDLAPVLDVARAGGAIAAEGRGFGEDPGDVAASGVAFADGVREAGVAATAKHFPGLGAAERNTDVAVETIELGGPTLRVVDAEPFRRFVEAGGELVMTSLATYPAYAARPAGFSRRVVQGELRRRVGFEGVVLTDSLETTSAAAFGSPAEVARAAAAAGNDLLLYPSVERARNASRLLVGDLERRPQLRAGYETATDRVLALRERLGGAPTR